MSGLDRISTLPDVLLCHILSFVPSKTAMATSMLSKRWRHLWLSVPTVDLDGEPFFKNRYIIGSHLRFVHFAYAVMLSLDVMQPILTLRLKCASPLSCAPCDLNLWVNSVVQDKVETIELSLPSTIKLPPSALLTCATLVVLKLGGLTVDNISSVSLPALKVLHLGDGVHFAKRQYLEMLLSCCPVLEDLQIKDLRPWSGDPPSLTEFSLPKLVRAYIFCIWVPIAKFHNVEILRTRVAEILIPELTFHNLIHMVLSVLSCKWYSLVRLLKYCPLLQILTIDNQDTSDDRELDYPQSDYSQSVPECLSLHLKWCYLEGLRCIDADIRFATYLMQNARVLRRIGIRSVSSSNIQEKFLMLKYLSQVPRSSTTCELLFE